MAASFRISSADRPDRDTAGSGAPLSWGDILVKNLIPVTIGNAIAGAFAPWRGNGKMGKQDARDRWHRRDMRIKATLLFRSF